MWTAHDTGLVVCAAAAILVVVLLVAVAKLHPFPALMIGALGMGLASGLGVSKLISSFETGAGSILGNVGLIVALGTMLGKLLAESGGADRIAQTVLRGRGQGTIPWAMAVVAMIVGIPLFFEIGVVLLIPIIFVTARAVQEKGIMRGGNAYLLVGLPALAGLSALHGLIPPHPGPLIAINALGANLGLTMLYGFIIAIPTVIIAGPVFARFAMRWAHADPPEELVRQVAGSAQTDNEPSFIATMATILLPVALMLIRTVIDVSFSANAKVRQWADFIGDPSVALLVGLLLALWTFGIARGFDRARLNRLTTQALAPIASILLIIGAGGGFKQILVDSGIGGAIGHGVHDLAISALLLGWVVAMLIRIATGSATVATVTASGVMAPIVAHSSVNRPLLALAIGCGSLFLSHVNDAGFWLINQYFGMSVPDTFKTWSALETLLSVVGMAFVMLASVII